MEVGDVYKIDNWIIKITFIRWKPGKKRKTKMITYDKWQEGKEKYKNRSENSSQWFKNAVIEGN